MAGFTPLPQTIVHSSTRLTHLQAHEYLSSFLREADVNPAYRPDAVLTQHGAQSAGSGSGTNLTLNHLSRILKGIAGERVGGVEFNYGNGPPRKKRKLDEDTDAQGQHADTVQQDGRSRRKQNQDHNGHEDVVEMADGDEMGQAAIVGHETSDWQDKEDYELAQVDETADLEGRDPADPGDEDAAPTIDAPTRTDDVDVGSVVEQTKSKNEKEQRKMAKQERWKKEKAERNEKHKKAKAKG